MRENHSLVSEPLFLACAALFKIKRQGKAVGHGWAHGLGCEAEKALGAIEECVKRANVNKQGNKQVAKPKDRICSVDTETTGLDRRTGAIVELAITPLDRVLNVDHSIAPFYVLVNPGREHLESLPMPCKAMLVNGLSRDKIAAEGVSPSVAVVLLREWMRATETRHIEPLSSNWSYDEKMLDEMMGFQTLSVIFARPARDSARVAKAINDVYMRIGKPEPFESCSLQALGEHFGLDAGKAHTALDDAMLCASVYRYLVRMLSTCPKCANTNELLAANMRLTKEAVGFEQRITLRDERLAVQEETIAGLRGEIFELKNKPE